jgi:hypothetical protein
MHVKWISFCSPSALSQRALNSATEGLSQDTIGTTMISMSVNNFCMAPRRLRRAIAERPQPRPEAARSALQEAANTDP